MYDCAHFTNRTKLKLLDEGIGNTKVGGHFDMNLQATTDTKV
jgi:hypothetical protein